MTVLSDGARESIGSGIASALRQIGYRPQLLRRQYDFVDFLDDSPIVRNVDLGVFGQEPFDYRSACLAFHFASSGDAASHTAKNLRAFGAPFVFLISEPNTEHWVLRESGITLNETFRTEELIGRLIAKGDAWGPSSILRAKSGFAPPDPEQIELFDPGLLPMLEAEAGRKLDVLVSRILYQAEKAFSKEGLDVDSKVVFNILFRFLSAKLLCDREVKTEHKIDFSAPIETLRAVDNYYRSTGLSSARQLSKAVLATIADEVGRAFSFRNISVDTLTYVYENTFVSPERRQSLGIHSTPSYIADYVLSQLPLEELQRDKLQVLDPTCGHGIFLIAAMRRMRTFMPTDWGGHRRHEFFVKHLTGVDIEIKWMERPM